MSHASLLVLEVLSRGLYARWTGQNGRIVGVGHDAQATGASMR